MYIDLNSFTPIIDIKEGKKISRLSDRYFAMANSWSIFFAWIVTQSMLQVQAKMGKCSFRSNYTAFCPLSQTNQGNAPLLQFDFLKIEFQLKTRFLDNRVISNCKFLKRKIYWNSSSVNSSSMQFFKALQFRFKTCKFFLLSLIAPQRAL